MVDYCIHICKNSRLPETDPNYCDKVFIEEDRENAQDYPSSQIYCPECVKKGFKNKHRKKLTEEQRKEIGKRLRQARKQKNGL